MLDLRLVGADLSRHQIELIAKCTIGQRDNELWREMRWSRLTASQFGKALRATQSERGLKRFVENWGIPMKDNQVLRYGRDSEPHAIKAVESKFGISVEPTGLWLLPCRYLGASPDGIFNYKDSRYVLEVKCPWTMRSVSQLDFEEKGVRPKYLDPPAASDGSLSLNKNHDYYHQIQAELLATGLETCWLVCWSPAGLLLTVPVHADQQWRTDVVPKLQQLYITHLLPLANQWNQQQQQRMPAPNYDQHPPMPCCPQPYGQYPWAGAQWPSSHPGEMPPTNGPNRALVASSMSEQYKLNEQKWESIEISTEYGERSQTHYSVECCTFNNGPMLVGIKKQVFAHDRQAPWSGKITRTFLSVNAIKALFNMKDAVMNTVEKTLLGRCQSGTSSCY